MRTYQIKLTNGNTVEITAHDIKFVGDNVCKVINGQWQPIYKINEVMNIKTRGKA